MELSLETPPKGVYEALRDGLGIRHTYNTLYFDVYSTGLTLTEPHPVYQLTLTSLINGSFLNEAFLVSWRFIVLENDSATAAIEVAVKSSPVEAYVFSRWNVGRYVEGTIEGVSRIETRISNQNMYLRLLQIPSLQLTALWLHGPNNPGGPIDFILPIVSPPAPVEPYLLYTPDTLLSILRPLANDYLDMNDFTEPFG
ncbi:hypothetical protein [Hymenobacter perfusus]|uniref:Uncharacterized protein n=1 Tax=Hymenobacter perfusus TaxID=1236770 RepID=A0A3R9MCR9_9BACT|nr:hypothetical protein [Hymenobacter perfusus]RSK38975.1 hypothetical protein EI293_20860 [Hymenobacter perfusus]